MLRPGSDVALPPVLRDTVLTRCENPLKRPSQAGLVGLVQQIVQAERTDIDQAAVRHVVASRGGRLAGHVQGLLTWASSLLCARAQRSSALRCQYWPLTMGDKAGRYSLLTALMDHGFHPYQAYYHPVLSG